MSTARRALACALLGGASVVPAARPLPEAGPLPEARALEEVIVTATARPEDRVRLTSTVQVIDLERIERADVASGTDLLAGAAAGFFSQWTPGQTSINLRGGASDGQGRDFRGQVLVLMNGRRAGTANLSKLSASDLARVEIVRGPASVVYGSQNIGGVINLITRDGRDTRGVDLQLSGGSRELRRGELRAGLQAGGWDAYFGAALGSRDDYRAGSGAVLPNTDWERWSLATSLGREFGGVHRLALSLRTDGVWDAGFRGSGGNVFNRDNRWNRSADLEYTGRRGDVQFAAHAYAVNDVDDFRWASPVVRNAANLPAPGTARDDNYRRLEVRGVRLQPVFPLWSGADVLVGAEWERSVLRSTRERAGVPGNALAQVPPQDNNQTDRVLAGYFEAAQALADERLVLRAGARWTDGRTRFDATPNLAAQRVREASYDVSTWSGGASWRVHEGLSLRAGASTGFRAPTGTELAADFTALGGGRSFGNPDLRPERSRQLEIGAYATGRSWSVDAALFQNVIRDRIVTQPRAGVANTSDFANNPDDIVVRGLEWQLEARSRLIAGVDWRGWLSGSWNFEMQDRGAPVSANSRRVQRMYEYQGALGSRLGGELGGRRAGLQLEGVLRGPMWYDTEESLLVPGAEPNRNFVHRKSAFWVWNLRADLELTEALQVYARVDNLLDVNEHPIFIAIDERPASPLADLRFYNGSGGTSMPGREWQLGLRLRF